jgi:hypothetical protein
MSPEVSDHSVQEAWEEEVVRRMEDFKAGKSATVPWEQVHRELVAMVNEPKQDRAGSKPSTLIDELTG